MEHLEALAVALPGMEYQIQEDHLLKLPHLEQQVMVMRVAYHQIQEVTVVVVAAALAPLVEVPKVLEFRGKVVLVVLVENLQPLHLMECLDFLQEEAVVPLTQPLDRL
tara:strand:- start:135 stop:458 length:324 start_codon:yes stop_codon:yes gene_type:complete